MGQPGPVMSVSIIEPNQVNNEGSRRSISIKAELKNLGFFWYLKKGLLQGPSFLTSSGNPRNLPPASTMAVGKNKRISKGKKGGKKKA